MSDFDEIQEALKVLGLKERGSLTLNELNKTYYEKIFQFHPDTQEQRRREGKEIHIIEELGIMQQINRAHEILRDYFREYKYTFTQEDVARVYPEDEFKRRQRKNLKEWYLNH